MQAFDALPSGARSAAHFSTNVVTFITAGGRESFQNRSTVERTGKAGLQELDNVELCMGDLVNLRAARKRVKRRVAERKAASNRLVHGRTKAEQTLEQFKGEKARRNLDQHRIETGDGQ